MNCAGGTTQLRSLVGWGEGNGGHTTVGSFLYFLQGQYSCKLPPGTVIWLHSFYHNSFGGGENVTFIQNCLSSFCSLFNLLHNEPTNSCDHLLEANTRFLLICQSFLRYDHYIVEFCLLGRYLSQIHELKI